MNLAMHMADGLISVPIGIIFAIISFGLIGYSIKKVNDEHDDKKIPMMAVMGAFVFVAQMINFTIPGTGSSGHIGGAILLCLVLGQSPAFLALASVLIIQCLFFGDGGLLALGCNIFNMGVVPCFIAYPFIIKPILSKGINVKNITLASMIGVIIGLQLGSFAVVLETLASRITELPFMSFVVLMQPIHLAIGIVEGLITTAVVVYVYKQQQDIVTNALEHKSFVNLNFKNVIITFVVLIVLVGGGLSLYASSNPDGLEWSIEGVTGSTELEANGSVKDTLAKIQESTAFLPDYNFSGSESNIGVSTSGIVGGACTLLLIGAVGFVAVKLKKHE